MNKGIVTIVLAAVGALVLVSLVGTWTGALNTEFVVFGQTSGGGGGGGGTGVPAPVPTSVQIVPQIALGTFDQLNDYSTDIQIINTGTSAASLTAEFFNQDGAPSSALFSTNDPQEPTFTGSLSGVTIAANQSLVVSAGGSGNGVVNWGRIETDGSLRVSTIFEVRQRSDGTLVSRVGVPSSDPDLRRFVVPRIRDARANRETSTAFAILNVGDSDASVMVDLYRNGQIVGSRTVTLAARHHTSLFANQFFTVADAEGRSFEHMIFESDVATIAATSLVFEGPNQATLPVGRIE